MALTEYNKKRNFNKTSEPKGSVKSRKSNRFVIQYHQARAKHYDFRLEYGGVLISWAVPKGLSTNPKDKRLAVMVEDHPVDYITFEGIIPKGNYGAGTVEIYDKGNYMPLEDMNKGLKKGHLKIVLNGEKLKGTWSLIRTNNNNWLVVKSEDEYVDETKPKSTKLPFRTCSTQLAILTDKIPKGKDWAFEIKYDGYRILSFVENGKVKMVTRNGVDYTSKFKNIIPSLKKLDAQNFVLDGEVVAFDENGRSDFGLLQNSIKQSKNNLKYVIFDLIAFNGEDLRDLPLSQRKAKLERLLFKYEDTLIYSQHVNMGKQSFEFAKKNNLEGIMAKSLNSTYTGKRTHDWLKIKCYNRQEFVIAGYTSTEKNSLISALHLGYYSGKSLKYVGKVGTGFNDKDRKELHKLFQKQIRKTCPFSPKISEKNTTWLTPTFVAEIQYAELTKDGVLRQPSFIALRQDKSAKDVTLEVKNAKGN